MRCFRDLQESCSPLNLRRIPLRALPLEHHAGLPLAFRLAGNAYRVFPGGTMPIAISACTDTPTDNRALDYLPSQTAVAVYVPKTIPATEA